MQQKKSIFMGFGILIIFIGYALAISRVNTDTLWYDEVISYYMIGAAQFEPLLPFTDFLERIIITDRCPPFTT